MSTTLFPMFTAPTAVQSQDLPLYRDVLMDYETGRPVWESGNPVFVAGLEAVKAGHGGPSPRPGTGIPISPGPTAVSWRTWWGSRTRRRPKNPRRSGM